MTSVMDVGVSEVSRVALWALRGLGMAFGVADRAAPLVSWAEAVEGGALRRLREISPQIDGPRSNPRRSQVSDATWRFDMSGRSLLELGPPAIDLLTMAARTGKVGRVDFLNTLDPDTAEVLTTSAPFTTAHVGGLAVRPTDGVIFASGGFPSDIYTLSKDGEETFLGLTGFGGVGDIAFTPLPTNKDQCKNEGWQDFSFPYTFKNQGDCIQLVNTGK